MRGEVWVYDGYELLDGGPECATGNEGGADFRFIREGTNMLFRDARSDELLAVGRLGFGTERHDASGFPACVLQTMLDDVPLRRDFYRIEIEGDQVLDGGITISIDDLVRFGWTAAVSYFDTDAEAERERQRRGD